MIDLTKKCLPSSVEVEGKFYKIHTDFQYWLNFSLMRKKGEIKLLTDCDYLYIHDIPENRNEGIKKLIEFCEIKKELPRAISGSNKLLIDFEIDSDLIYSAFYENYGIDLVDSKLHLHWFKFNALFDGLHRTKLNEVMSYRGYDETDKTSYEKSLIKLRQAWELPAILSDEEKKALTYFDSLFY